MKEPSPLVPQGSFEAMARGKSHVRIAFYTIVAVHLLVIGGLLILGCKREDKAQDAAGELPPQTNDMAATPPFGSDPAVVSPEPAVTSSSPAIVSTATPPSASTGLTTIPPVVPPPIPTPMPPIETVESVQTEHTIVARDTFGSLATKYGVSIKAIQAANPGVDATRLKIGQKIKIPPKALTAARNGTGMGASPTADSGDTYVVKSGDNLSKIASSHGTTVRDVQRLNNLSTTQIRVGQKLRVPPRSAPGIPNPGAVPAPAPAQ